MKVFPGIISLRAFIKDNAVSTERLDDSFRIYNTLHPFLFKINAQEILIHVEDEYDDLKVNNPLLDIVLCIQELELAEESTDYLNWLQFQLIKNSTGALRNYYQNLVAVIPKLRTDFPENKITSFIPELDFQLNSNSVYYLRNKTIS